MNTIDHITVILGPPASPEGRAKLAADAETLGESIDEAYIARIPDIVAELTSTNDGEEPSDLDRFLSELMGLEVDVLDPIPTWFEKKGKRYPAIMIVARNVIGPDGGSLENEVTATFTRPETPAALAERIGKRLDLESAKTFYTFGARD